MRIYSWILTFVLCLLGCALLPTDWPFETKLVASSLVGCLCGVVGLLVDKSG
jgi:uncharacterized membrane protein YccC